MIFAYAYLYNIIILYLYCYIQVSITRINQSRTCLPCLGSPPWMQIGFRCCFIYTRHLHIKLIEYDSWQTLMILKNYRFAPTKLYFGHGLLVRLLEILTTWITEYWTVAPILARKLRTVGCLECWPQKYQISLKWQNWKLAGCLYSIFPSKLM